MLPGQNPALWVYTDLTDHGTPVSRLLLSLQVHMYNIPSLPAMTTTMADLRKAQELFPEGQALAVIEPFFKLMLDGTYGVRVDNPAEVGGPALGWFRLVMTSDQTRQPAWLPGAADQRTSVINREAPVDTLRDPR